MGLRSRALGRRRKTLLGIAITVALMLSGIPSHAASSSDDFATAFVITETPFSDVTSNADATTEAGEPQPSCSTATGATVWYAFTPDETVRIDASTFGSKFDTVLAAYTGSSLEELVEVACNDDATNVGSRQSRLRIVARADKTLFLQVGGYQGETGALTLSLDTVPLPANDDFASAAEISSIPFSTTVNLYDASLQEGEPAPDCDGWDMEGSVWYRFVPTEDIGVMFTSGNEGSESLIINVYRGDSLESLSRVTCSYPDWWDSITVGAFRATAGNAYHIQVGPAWHGFSPVDLTFEAVDLPPNDDFEDALEIDAVPASMHASTWTTTLEEGEPTDCKDITSSVWYRYTAKDPIPLIASARSDDLWPVVGVYEGTSMEDLTLVACSGFYAEEGDSFIPIPGRTYYLQAGPFSWGWGTGEMTIRLRPGVGIEDPLLTYSSAAADVGESGEGSGGAWVDGLLAEGGASVERDGEGIGITACADVFDSGGWCLDQRLE